VEVGGEKESVEDDGRGGRDKEEEENP